MKQCKCKKCGNEFEPILRNGLKVSNLCIPCVIEKAKCKNKAITRKEKKQALERIKTQKDYIKELQTIFNRFIRLRDENKPCISCGALNCEEWHAGHYIATTYQYLRFNENNVHKQCSKCNTWLRGNSIPYRISLISRIGIDEVEKLENERNKEFLTTIIELKEMIEHYKQKIKSLK